MQDKILSSSYLNSMIHSKLSVLSNWFSRFEARLLFWLLMALKDCPASFSAAHHALAIRTCGLLHSPDEILVRDLLELIVFNKSFLKSEDLLAQHLDRISVHETLPLASASTRDSINTSLIRSMEKSMDNIQDIKTMYLEKLLNDTKCRHSLSYHNSENSGVQVLTFECETVLSLDWQYFPLLETYNLEQNNKLTNICLPAIMNCLSWLLISNTSTRNSSKAELTSEYCRLATVFLAGNDFFLDAEVHVLLSSLLNEILAGGCLPDMSLNVPGISSGHEFYNQMLNQFQAVSYGDQLFSMFICLPAAVSQPALFRKSLWLERQELVKSITLKKEHFQEKIFEAFLYPFETELELVVSYFQCIILGYIHKKVQSFMYEVAVHHIKHFLIQETSEPEVLKFIDHVKKTVKGELKCDLGLL